MRREYRINREETPMEPWERLLILADDFTGAMDSGVQLAKHGLRVQVTEVSERASLPGLEKGTVLVLDTETRHSSKSEAYTAIAEITKWAVKQGIRYFYKKTDSALRGNIGAELEALLTASGADMLFFAPAFPQIGRITRGGTQYWDGVPIHKTSFGQDPFEPVQTAFVPDVIAQQSGFSCGIAASGTTVPDGSPAILVYDAESEEDLAQIAESLRMRPLPLAMAGCAGFAAMLPRLFEAKQERQADFPTAKNLLVVSGSVHPVTERQLEYARKNGVPVHDLDGTQLAEAELLGAERAALLQQLALDLQKRRCACLAIRPEPVKDNADAVRERISKRLADLAAAVLEQDPATGLLATGGDTLRSVAKRLNCHGICPIGEIFPGVVAAQMETSLGSRGVVTKAGGIGAEDVFLKTAEILLREPEKGV